AKGFLNGILRSLSTIPTDDHVDKPGPDALPLEGGVFRRLNRPVLADPVTKPVDYVTAAFALPLWLVQRWLPRYGFEECLRLGFWFAGPAPLTLRVNSLRIARDDYLAACAKAGMAAVAGEHPQAVVL